MNFYTFFNSTVYVVIWGVSFMENSDWEHFSLNLQDRNMKVK